MRQVNLITAINGNTITVKNPHFIDFSTGNPNLRHAFALTTRMSGIEDLKLDHSTSPTAAGINWSNCYACWVKGVESYKAVGYHIVMSATLNAEIRDSLIHDAQTYGNNNAGISVYGSGYGTGRTAVASLRTTSSTGCFLPSS